MSENTNLRQASKTKNDEFYTQYNDIEAELTAYYEYNHEVFRNKIVLCPCDDPDWSNFTVFLATNFKRYGLKALISTSYAGSALNKKISKSEKESPLYDPIKRQTHGKLYVMTGDMNGDGKIDSDDVSFQKYLDGNGDFRSKEVTALRDEADIIVTNPPFSLFREFLNWIMDGEKQFAIIGNMNAITYKEVFPLIKSNKIWTGYQQFTGNRWYYIDNNNDDYVTSHFKFAKKDEKGEWIVPQKTIWFTNLEHGKRHEKMELDTMANNLRFNRTLRKKIAKYGDLDHYPKYDNYNAIEVPMVKCIPNDYKGAMGVPITFLDSYNPEQFEILGGFNNSQLKDKPQFDYVPSTNTPAIISGKEKLWNGPTINKKTLYYRIIIKNKHPK